MPYIETEEDPLDAHCWFHQALMGWESQRIALQHAEVYVESLNGAGKSQAAHVLIGQLRRIDPDFKP